MADLGSTDSSRSRAILCIFCRDTISENSDDSEKFSDHIRNTHNIQHYSNMILGFNLMDKDNLERIDGEFKNAHTNISSGKYHQFQAGRNSTILYGTVIYNFFVIQLLR